jgi:phage shock protein PspC (stress-responsive transcriptional regulator)
MDPQRVPVIGTGQPAETPTAPPPPPGGTAPPPSRPPLRRATGAAILGGVAAGVARTLDLDVALVRIAMVVLALPLNGLGVIAYLAAWALIPPDDEPTAGPPRRGVGVWIGAGLIGLGTLMVLERLGDAWGWGVWRPWRWFAADLVLPLGLVVVGALLWWRSGEPDGAVRRIAAGGPAAGAGTAIGDGSATAEAPAWARRAATEDWRLAPLTMGLALMVLGGLWTTDGLEVTSLGGTRIAAATLLVLGLGLLVGSIAGRARGLILPGAVLAVVVLGMRGAERADASAFGTPGVSTLERPATVADIPAGGYEWGAGDVVLDLSRLDAVALLAAEGAVVVRAELGVGTLEVVVPRGVGLDVEASVGIGTLAVDPDADLQAEVGIGRLDVPGSDQRGLGLRRDADTSAAGVGPILDLRLDVGVGRITITEG